MASGPRSDVIDDDHVGTYHCFNRCVRRAYLCGEDFDSGQNYEHRKDWIREMLVFLAGIFAVDILKYAVQDNHFHLILRNRPDLTERWSKDKILRRAMKLFPEKFRRTKLYVEPDEPLPEALLNDEDLIEEMRKRLSSISWLMKTLQERIAKRANREDGVTGVFWDGRFRCEALLDEASVLSAGMYIDLNLIRAGKCSTPEKSKFTSAYDRIQGLRARRQKRSQQAIRHDGFLSPLSTQGDYQNEDLAAQDWRASNDGIFEIPLTEYLRLLDYFGRQVRADKRGAIPSDLPPILERLGLEPTRLTECIESFASMSRRAIGSVDKLREKAEQIGRQWLHGIRRAKQFYLQAEVTTASK